MTTPKYRSALGLSASLLLSAALPSQAALVLAYEFENSADPMENTGPGSLTWNGNTGVTTTTGGQAGDAGVFGAGADVWSNSLGSQMISYDSFTFALAVRTTSTAAWDDMISFGTDAANQFFIEQRNDGTVAVYSNGTPGGIPSALPALVSSAGPINDGTWHHLAVTSDGSDLRLYQDGVEVGSVAYAPTAGTNLDVLQLSSRFGDGVRKWNGDLDEVRIYNNPLSAAEISQLASVPEPSALLLMGLGLGLGRRRRP